MNTKPRGSDPLPMVQVGDAVYFSATTSIAGRELWKTDGTESGTVQVVDLETGIWGSLPTFLNASNLNGTLYFAATKGFSKPQLWKTDGTADGTKLVKDVDLRNAYVPSRSGLFELNGMLYFRASDGVHGDELWKSDGTTDGTVMVADISPGGSSPRDFTNVNGTLYFLARAAQSYALWRSDGSETGTVLVKDFPSPGGGRQIYDLTNVNGTLYFRANDGSSGSELWKSNGTEVGTHRVKDIAEGSAGSTPRNFTEFNGSMVFQADDGVHGLEFWMTDGSEEGTVLVKDIWEGATGSLINVSSNVLNANYFINVNGTLYFTANDGQFGLELWKSDGTPDGTMRFTDLAPGRTDAWPWQFRNIGGVLYFSASDGATGYELWKSDGTESGTVLIKDILPGSGWSYPKGMFNLNGTILFSANDGSTGTELWKSDGTEAGTTRVKDIMAANGRSVIGGVDRNVSINSFISVDGNLFFRANDGTHGYELWKSDGSETGTVLVRDVRPGDSSGLLNNSWGLLTNADGTVFFFAASGGATSNQLWKSDGTEDGTVMVKDIRPGQNGGSAPIATVDGTLFLVANDGTHGSELWKSDGTEAGTVMVKDIQQGTQTGIRGSYPQFAAEVGGTLFFSASEASSGAELWKSDGTEEGTLLVKDIVAGSEGSGPRHLTNVDGVLFFLTADDTLWKSDGTEAGTVMVKKIWGAKQGTPAKYLTNVNGTLYFQANDGTNGEELWKSDGTEKGTVMVMDIWPGPDSASPRYFEDVNGSLFFTANDGSTGWEIWKSDGTQTGTTLVKDIYKGKETPVVSLPSNLTNVNGVLYFRADDGVHSQELWRSDGTEDGTVRVASIAPVPVGLFPGDLTNVDGTLFFSAVDADHSRELWRLVEYDNSMGRFSLSSRTLEENLDANAVVGNLETETFGFKNAYTYQLVAGTGSDDNSAFKIVGNSLRAADSFDFETKSVYKIRIRSTDQYGRFSEQPFTITVVDTNDPFRNPLNPYDVDNDGAIAPLDVLNIIDLLNTAGASVPTNQLSAGEAFVNVNGDGRVDPLDVLILIDFLNARKGNGEGESRAAAISIPTPWSGPEQESLLAGNAGCRPHEHRSKVVGDRMADQVFAAPFLTPRWTMRSMGDGAAVRIRSMNENQSDTYPPGAIEEHLLQRDAFFQSLDPFASIEHALARSRVGG